MRTARDETSNEKYIFSYFSGVGEGGRRGRPPMRNIEKSCQGVHDPPTLETFENIYFSFEVSSLVVHTVRIHLILFPNSL